MRLSSMLIIILFTICIFSNSLIAQKQGQDLIDSLQIELKKASKDTNQVRLIYDLSFEFYSIDPEEGIKLADRGIRLAKELGWSKGEALCYNAKGVNNWVMGNLDKALDNYKTSSKIFERIGSKQGMASSLGNIGILYNIRSEYSKALEYYQQALKIVEQIGNKDNTANTLINIGVIYNSMTDYEHALVYYQKALDIIEETGNKNSMASTLGNIANIYKSLSNRDQALSIFIKALDISEEIGNKNLMATYYGNIGNLHYENKNYDQALTYYSRALPIHEETGSQQGTANILGSIGLIYSDMDSCEQAFEHLDRALAINIELGSKENIAHNLISFGNLHFKLTKDSVINKIKYNTKGIVLNKNYNLKKALDYSLEALKIAKDIDAKNILVNQYQTLQAIYKEKGDYRKAYEFLLKQKTTQDSIFSVDNRKEIQKMTSKFEREQREKEEALLASIEGERINNRNMIQYTGILVFIILLFTAIVLIAKFKVPFAFIDGLVFITFLLFYELVLVIAEPWIDDWTNNIPIYKLCLNLTVALLFIPFHRYERKMRMKYKQL